MAAARAGPKQLSNPKQSWLASPGAQPLPQRAFPQCSPSLRKSNTPCRRHSATPWPAASVGGQACTPTHQVTGAREASPLAPAQFQLATAKVLHLFESLSARSSRERACHQQTAALTTSATVSGGTGITRHGVLQRFTGNGSVTPASPGWIPLRMRRCGGAGHAASEGNNPAHLTKPFPLPEALHDAQGVLLLEECPVGQRKLMVAHCPAGVEARPGNPSGSAAGRRHPPRRCSACICSGAARIGGQGLKQAEWETRCCACGGCLSH